MVMMLVMMMMMMVMRVVIMLVVILVMMATEDAVPSTASRGVLVQQKGMSTNMHRVSSQSESTATLQ
eukprot:1630310-Pyramimonas_sp.AAC.1